MSNNNPERHSPPPTLSDAEWEIMKPLWKQGPMASRDIVTAVGTDRDWSPKTIKSMLGRLVKKGVVTYEQIGNSYLYRAVHSQESVARRAAGSFLERVFDGSLTPFIAHFARDVSDDELQALKAELNRIERERSEKE